MRALLWINSAIFALASVSYFYQRRFAEAAFLVLLSAAFGLLDIYRHRHAKH